jgi:hypothetical protein
MNTSFSSRPAIFFCRDAVNDDTGLIASIVLKMKLAAGEENFLGRPRPRLIDSVGTIELVVMRSACSEFDSIDDSIDDSTDDKIDDSIDDSADESDNSSLA